MAHVPQERPRSLDQRDFAVALFEAGHATLGQCARLSDLPQEEFITLLGELGIDAVDYSPEELAAEIERAM